MSIEPIDQYDVNLVHPAVDLDSDKAYIGAWILSRIHKKKGTKIQHAHYIITSDREMIKSKKLGSMEMEGDIFLKFQPVRVKATWSKRGVDQFLGGYIPNPVEIYDRIKSELIEYVDFYDPRDYDLVTLWIIGTYFYTIFNAYPYMYIGGIKRTGKTKTLTLAKSMTFNGIMSSDMSSPSLFRLIQNARCTVMIDETERLKDPNRLQQFRQLMNQGYKRAGVAYRSASRDERHAPTPYEVYSPKMLANIRGLDNVLEDRTIITIMRRSMNPKILNAEIDERDQKWEDIRNSLYALALSIYQQVRTEYRVYDIDVPEITGRERELWRSIIVLARLFSALGVKIDKTHVLLARTQRSVSSQSSLYGMIVDFAKEKVKMKITEEVTEVAETILARILVEIVDHDAYYLVKEVKSAMEGYYDEPQKWLSNKWVGNALRRLRFLEKRRIGRGYEYKLAVKEVHDLAWSLGLDIDEILKEKKLREEKAEEEEETAPVKL